MRGTGCRVLSHRTQLLVVRITSMLTDALALTSPSRTDLGYLSDDRRRYGTCAYTLLVADARKGRR